MITLDSSSTEIQNIIIFPVRDQVLYTATTDYYVFRCLNKETLLIKDFLVDDDSANRLVYQQFPVRLTGGTENLDNAVVDLRPIGYWEFKLYPATGATTSDIVESQLLSSGFLRVI